MFYHRNIITGEFFPIQSKDFQKHIPVQLYKKITGICILKGVKTIMVIDNLTNCEELEILKRNNLKVAICEGYFNIQKKENNCNRNQKSYSNKE